MEALRAACLLDGPDLVPLPADVVGLLVEVRAPARLGAHLRAVHDVAHRLVERCDEIWPGLLPDPDAVRFGAAVHDIGKVLHPAELSGPGSRHERAGRALLLDHGIEDRLARFAQTHAAWDRAGASVEDLAVSLADKVWKGHRVTALEDRFLSAVEACRRAPRWESFLRLDDVLTDLAELADERLAFQNAYPAVP